jgi:hypothetical protein
MVIKRSALIETLEELGDVIAENNILVSIKNDEDFDLMLEPLSKDNTK